MRFSMRHFVTNCCWMLIGMMAGPAIAADPTPEQLAHFESHIRPLLVKRCVECHGANKQQGDVRLDRRIFAIGEGDGPVVPGKVDESRLIDVIQYDELDTQMPPAGKLPDDEIQLLTEWVKAGRPGRMTAVPRRSPTGAFRGRLTARSTLRPLLSSTGRISRSSVPNHLPCSTRIRFATRLTGSCSASWKRTV